MADERDKPKSDPDQPVKIDLDPEDALKGLLEVDPTSQRCRTSQTSSREIH